MKTMLEPPLEWFEQWMAETGEPIPDFGALPSVPELPDLLRGADGAMVADPADWPRRRDELRDLVRHWLTGTWPDEAPALADVQ